LRFFLGGQRRELPPFCQLDFPDISSPQQWWIVLDVVLMHGLPIAASGRIAALHRDNEVRGHLDLGVLSSDEDFVEVGGFLAIGPHDLDFNRLIDLAGYVGRDGRGNGGVRPGRLKLDKEI
jgi:hypothetical protein